MIKKIYNDPQRPTTIKKKKSLQQPRTTTKIQIKPTIIPKDPKKSPQKKSQQLTTTQSNLQKSTRVKVKAWHDLEELKK